MRFNSDLLRVARQVRGLSQAKLSVESGLTQGAISKVENGLSEPSGDVAQKLADTLRFPLSYFYQSFQPFGLPVSVHPMFRKKASVPVKELEQLEAGLNLRLSHYQTLLRSIEVDRDLELPKFDLDDYDNDPVAIASLVRRTWQVPRGPIKNLVEYVERAGCIVVHCDFDNVSVSGVTIALKGLPPFIFLNRNNPADRQRFTLAHELGHIVMHRLPTPDMESEADRFAGALLLPPDQIAPYFMDGVSLPKLAALKPVWRVSMASLLVAANNLGYLTPNQNQWLWRQFSAKGYRTTEPPELNLKVEEPSVIRDIIQVHLDEHGYTEQELATALHTELSDLRRLHGLEPVRVGLRVVK